MAEESTVGRPSKARDTAAAEAEVVSIGCLTASKKKKAPKRPQRSTQANKQAQKKIKNAPSFVVDPFRSR